MSFGVPLVVCGVLCGAPLRCVLAVVACISIISEHSGMGCNPKRDYTSSRGRPWSSNTHLSCKRFSGEASRAATAALLVQQHHLSCKRFSRCATTGASATSGGAAAHFSAPAVPAARCRAGCAFTGVYQKRLGARLTACIRGITSRLPLATCGNPSVLGPTVERTTTRAGD